MAAETTGIQVADWIAGLALVLSVLTTGRSFWFEHKIQAQADRRSAFDATISIPLGSKLELLEPILTKFDAICANETDAAARQQRLSELQNGEHTTWFFGTDAFLRVLDPNSLDDAEARLHRYWDDMADLINSLSEDVASVEVANLRKKMARVGGRFINEQRSLIQELRSKA